MQLSAIKNWIYDLVSLESISKEVSRILLCPTENSHLLYQAGQYIKIIHSNGNISPLSIANAPQENGLIELQLTHSPDNLQAQDILRTLSEEKKLIFRGPYGSCTLEKLYTGQRIIFLARGTGFAPIKAIIEEITTFKKYPPIHFYWCVTSPDEFYMDELLEQWVQKIEHFSYTPILSRPHPQWHGRTGLLQDIVLQDYSEIATSLVYISAPEPVVHDVLHALQKADLPRDQYYSDVFDYCVDE